MKVIEEGHFDFEHAFSCRRCHSRLQADMQDVKRDYFGSALEDGPGDLRYYLTCPLCGEYEFLARKIITPQFTFAFEKKGKK